MVKECFPRACAWRCPSRLVSTTGGGGVCAEGLSQRDVVGRHPHICRAKFQQNHIICSTVIAI